MWVEKEKDAKGKRVYRFREEYTDKLTGKTKTVSVKYPRNNQRVQQKALLELNALIEERQRKGAVNMTFGELIDEWLVEYKGTVKIGSFINTQSKVKQLGELKDILLPELTATHINRYLRNMKRNNLAKSTINAYSSMFRLIITFGYTYGELADRSLLDGIKTPSFSNEEKRKKADYLEQNELDSVVKQLRDLGYDEIARMVLLQTYTGTRHSELVAIDYENNIDWEEKTILINRTYVPSAKDYNLPKNSEIRIIHFNEETEKLLREQIQYTKLKTMSKGLSKEPILFKNSLGNPMTSNGLWYTFQKIKVPGKTISTHIFRHTFITRAFELGMPRHLVAEHVGDKIETVDQHYRHFSKKMGTQLKKELSQMSFGN